MMLGCEHKNTELRKAVGAAGDGFSVHPNDELDYCFDCNRFVGDCPASRARDEMRQQVTAGEFNGEVLGRVTTYLSQFDEFQPEGDDSAAQSAKNLIDCIDRLRSKPVGNERFMKMVAIITATTSLGENQVYSLAEHLIEALGLSRAKKG